MNPNSPIELQVMWNRLLAIVEEQAQVLVRTAFSTSTREAGDVSAGVFDTAGRMLAQAVTGTPGHVNSMALSVRHFIETFPLDSMREGDCYLTNDPWKGTGHLYDFTVVSPAFRNGDLVGLFACTSHVVDIGGIGPSPDGRQVYHEGLMVPMLHFAKAGVVQEWLLEVIRQNVREPLQVEGDLYALAACNAVGSGRLVEMMDEYAIDSLDALSHFIISTTRNAMQAAIRELPHRKARYRMVIDGYDQPVELVASLCVCDDQVVVDFEGSSAISDYGINCPKCYTDAYTAFGVKCILAPSLPNNAGLLETIRISAPQNSIVNAPRPCAVNARAAIGHMLPDLVFGCLHQLLPGRVPAEGTSGLWNLRLAAGHGITSSSARVKPTPFNVMSFHSGGAGARPTYDGLSATPFPSGVRNVAVEITEAITPIVIWRKDLRVDSGGPGKYRGGLGQVMVVASRESAPFAIYATFDRTRHPPRGRDGGCPGALGKVRLQSGLALKNMGRHEIPAGERLVIEMPGGGGYGNPMERDPQCVALDVKNGFVSPRAAQEHYGVSLTEECEVNSEATAAARMPFHSNSLGDPHQSKGNETTARA